MFRPQITVLLIVISLVLAQDGCADIVGATAQSVSDGISGPPPSLFPLLMKPDGISMLMHGRFEVEMSFL